MSDTEYTNQDDASAPAQEKPFKRVSRLGLFLPVAFLMVLVAAWSAFWFIARTRVNDAITIWLAQEEEQQRQWSCPNRSVSGFPFRFEIRCKDLRFKGSAPEGTLDGILPQLTAVSQVYKPNHVIFEAKGPLIAHREDGERLIFGWQSFNASAVFSGNRLDRLSYIIKVPSIEANKDGYKRSLLHAEMWEAHLRINPERPSDDNVYDVAIKLDNAQIPALNAIFASEDNATIAFQGSITKATSFTARAPFIELERWRVADGVVEIGELSFSKGAQLFQAHGQLSLDDERRLQGRIQASVHDLDHVLGTFGLNNQNRNMLKGFSVLAEKNNRPNSTQQKLLPLPPIAIREGKLFVGPFGIGQVKPLY